VADRPRLVLASASSARLETLRRAGFDPAVVVSGVDESTVVGNSPPETALALARLKAHAVAARTGPDALVLGCDSVLELDGQTLGKPAGAADAAARWRRMRGREGILHTGHCLVATTTGKEAAAVASTLVRFGRLTDEEITAYVDTGEPLRVAGAFTVDGLGGPFVDGLEGDPHNVVGISLPLLRRLLADHGVAVPDLWARRGNRSATTCTSAEPDRP
jgi:septum formation protein